MAKGQKLTTSRSERYLGSYSYGRSHETVTEAEDLCEDAVWSVVEDVVNGCDHHSIGGSQGTWHPRTTAENNGSTSIRSRGHVGGLSLAFEDSGKTASAKVVHQLHGPGSIASLRRNNMATSIPVNVPDWSKVYWVDSIESLHDSYDGADDQGFETVPPHEYLAREYRRMDANSVFEGIGRTLKGWDMSRVRDAVWNQTGFNG
ncbi:protein S40-6-like [Actinidia eriantha]|uniref:protein S40-6-like n=1 Tax=Actinidia eriantha TaxID=165200 RepID=UPI002583678C|nr:protein S40-6-like [Actinidia eriantha]